MIDFFQWVWIWIAIASITLVVLVFTRIRAPYGRHARKGWGAMIPNKWGWIIMEFPALLICPLLAILGPQELSHSSILLVSLWILHYFNRTIVYPMRIKTSGKVMPLFIVGSALLFNGMNGFINGYYLGYLSVDDHVLSSPHVIAGLTLFVAGMIINIRTDNYLIALRKTGVGYQVPQGGLFNYISCPNHFGEILEWTGFALIGWSLPAASFAIWTFSNLVPRALNHHSWYQEHFTDYPTRKAVIPYFW